MGTFDGGREKAPAAICRKVIEAKINNKEIIDVWGDGTQTRSFLFIDDCIDAVMKLFYSDFSHPINIGSVSNKFFNGAPDNSFKSDKSNTVVKESAREAAQLNANTLSPGIAYDPVVHVISSLFAY